MQYRKFGKLGIDVSAFGVGCMRFPMIKLEDGTDAVDESVSTPVIRHAIDCGVKVNILGADTRNIDGKAFGTMLVSLPDDKASRRKVMDYLNDHPGVTAEEVQ